MDKLFRTFGGNVQVKIHVKRKFLTRFSSEEILERWSRIFGSPEKITRKLGLEF